MLIGSECEAHDGLHTSMENHDRRARRARARRHDARRPARRDRRGRGHRPAQPGVPDDPLRQRRSRGRARPDAPCACGRGARADRSDRGPRHRDAARRRRPRGRRPRVQHPVRRDRPRRAQLPGHAARSTAASCSRSCRTAATGCPSASSGCCATTRSKYLPGAPFAIEFVDDIPLTAGRASGAWSSCDDSTRGVGAARARPARHRHRLPRERARPRSSIGCSRGARERGATGKLGVIVNELGEIGIDGALLGGRGRARRSSCPAAACAACSATSSRRTLLELVETQPGARGDRARDDRRGRAAADRVGASQRAPVDEHVRLAAVVTLVDASNFRGVARGHAPRWTRRSPTPTCVLVTKAELAGAAETALVEAAIRTLAPRALVWIRGTDEHAAWLEDVLADPSIERERAAHPGGPITGMSTREPTMSAATATVGMPTLGRASCTRNRQRVGAGRRRRSISRSSRTSSPRCRPTT